MRRPHRWLLATGLGVMTGAVLGRLGSRRSRDGEARSTAFAVVRAAAVSAIDDRIVSVAAAVAFYSLLSLVPALSVFVSIYGLFTPPASIPGQLDALGGLLPADVRALVQDQAVRLASLPGDSLSATLLVSLGVAGWSANAAVKGVFEGLGVMYGVEERRSFLRLNAVTLGLTFAAVVTAIVALLVLAVAPALIAHLPLTRGAETGLTVVRWAVLSGLIFAALVVLYRIGPSRAPPPVRLLLPGALFATTAWATASALFSWYATTLASYPATYGSLAGVVVALTWMWISAIVVLAGAEITAEIEARQAGGGG